MTTTAVRYALDEHTMVAFEIEPPPGFQQAGAHELVGDLGEALAPAVMGARAVLDKVKESGPDEVQVRFGIKVSGTMNWLIARAAADGNFEVVVAWKRGGT